MYLKIRDLPLTEQVEYLTSSLVEIRSINGTSGEVEIADTVESIIRSFPYFQQNPENVWVQALPGDSLGRKNVFARVKGKGRSKKTVIFHGHIDTVGVHDFGQLEQISTYPEKLLEFFKGWEENQEIQQQAQSGEWMFGRGSVDMKSGVAVHLANLLYFSEHREDWDGQILFMANPVEENQHSGIIASLEELIRLRDEDELEYLVAVNTDFTSPLYTGDTTKYIYTGAVGKLLPCFYVYGRETHVGQTLNGLDPTLVTSELNKMISNNMDLAEDIEGELILPPSTLYLRDTKESYNVQTAVTSLLYFNYMVYEASPKQIMDKLQQIARRAAENITHYYQQQFDRFIKMTGLPAYPPSWDIKVYTYQEYWNYLTEQGIDVGKIADEVADKNHDLEPRELCFKIVDALRMVDRFNHPCIIVFFAPPYCPHNSLQTDSQNNHGILESIREVLDQAENVMDETFTIKRFFPYLSDSSYLSLHDSDEEIESLIRNFPEWDKIYPVPIKKIRGLNILAMNIGVYGVDAHRWTERVYKPYSFEKLPRLIRSLTEKWLATY